MHDEIAAPETTAPEVSADSAPAPAPRKRGRPPGSRNKAATEPLTETPVDAKVDGARAPRGRPRKVPQIDSGLLARQIQGLHLVAARATGLPELELQESEALLLSEAVASVSREYGLALDGKTGAVLQLLGACAIIYMPRLAQVTARRKAARIKHDEQPADPAAH